jgi:hypothetical protein
MVLTIFSKIEMEETLAKKKTARKKKCYHPNLVETQMKGCRVCESKIICVHRGVRHKCIDCGLNCLCIHRHRATECRECNGVDRCSHDRFIIRCVDCAPKISRRKEEENETPIYNTSEFSYDPIENHASDSGIDSAQETLAGFDILWSNEFTYINVPPLPPALYTTDSRDQVLKDLQDMLSKVY